MRYLLLFLGLCLTATLLGGPKPMRPIGRINPAVGTPPPAVEAAASFIDEDGTGLTDEDATQFTDES